jgi:hypothetical protein
MATLIFEEISILLAVIVIGLAVKKWHVIRDRQLILSVMKLALSNRKAFWIGTLFGIIYLAIFMILGGKGGRIHILFGRVIFNTSPGEAVLGLVLAVLVAMSMTLSVYGIHIMGFAQSRKRGGIGLAGSLLAVLASFCP